MPSTMITRVHTQRNVKPTHGVVRVRSAAASRGTLAFAGLVIPCALGRSGIRSNKREGDGASPRGSWSVIRVLYHPGRVARPRTMLPVSPIRANDGWCDAVGDRNYNCRVKHPYLVSAEKLLRDDGLYDFIVVLNYNMRPRVQGRGSAIFMHVARDGYLPTEGCIALKRDHLQRVLLTLTRSSTIRIG